MDRAAKLTKEARLQLVFEAASPNSPDVKRKVTRQMLAEEAEDLGFAQNEISAAVDEALAAAGTTP